MLRCAELCWTKAIVQHQESTCDLELLTQSAFVSTPSCGVAVTMLASRSHPAVLFLLCWMLLRS